MAKTPLCDPALDRLRRAIDESNDAAVPVTLNVHGARLEGDLIPESAYHAALARENPMLAALDPHSELADKKYAATYADNPEHYLHLLARTPEGRSVPWRVREDAVDAWSLTADESGRGNGEGSSGLARLFAPRAV